MNRLLLIAAVAVILSVSGCGREPVRSVMTGRALGTSYSIVIWSDDQVDLTPRLDSLFRAADNSMSIFNGGSLLSRLNRNETDSLDEHLISVLTAAEGVSRESGGYFDVTVKPLVSVYGFAEEEAVREPNVDSIMEFVGYEGIRIADRRLVKDDPRTQIDLNAIAKGYVVNLVSDYIYSLGYPDHLVEIGGEVSARGLRSDGTTWRVSIDDPFEGNNIPGLHTLTDADGKKVIINFTDAGMASSANNRRFEVDENGRKYVHTINPLTGRPEINDMLHATVIAPNTTLADAYATLFMVMGFEKSRLFLEGRDDIEALLVYLDENGRQELFTTAGMKEKMD